MHGGVVGCRKHKFFLPASCQPLEQVCCALCASSQAYNCLTFPGHYRNTSELLENHVLCGCLMPNAADTSQVSGKAHDLCLWLSVPAILIACRNAITRLSSQGFRLPSQDGFPSVLFSYKGLRDVRVVRQATGDMPKIVGKRDFDPKPMVPAPVSCEPLLFIEACCGSATLAAAAKQAGFEVMAIDHHQNQHDPTVKCIYLDLRANAARVFLDHVRKHGWLFYLKPILDLASSIQK